jgi:hypothetical protein
MDSGFESIGFYDGNEVEMTEKQVFTAGWVDSCRTIKQFDMRTGELSAMATVPNYRCWQWSMLHVIQTDPSPPF